ncbi:MAG: hypothetical protein J0H92_14100 [Sphingobacteriales bacterium]|jgi:hypothetical protein|nr:hypothetical protein [Sphingobacteriales bacterium]MBP7555728.1 hypothetical protein [Chitinophagaceae bacterium]NCT76440.1 hypothetical protein [Chitinophagaceae bacterium]OJW33659.1 MAG: hypothetical protein BGO54_10495 [Sphingobacteriales bacterium 46-32]
MKNLVPFVASTGPLTFFFRLLLLLLLLFMIGWLFVEAALFIRLFDVVLAPALPVQPPAG